MIRGVSFENEREAEAYLLADNRLVQTGGWDEAKLTEILRDLQDAEALTGVGWSEDQVAEMLALADGTAAEQVVGKGYQEDLKTYEAAEIKQVVLYFEADKYEDVLKRLGALMERRGITTHTGAFMALLEHYEATPDQEVPDQA